MNADGPPVPEQLPDSLIDHLDVLEAPELRAVHAYVERRLEECSTSIAKQILAEAAGEVVDIEDHEAYTLVRMHPPREEESDGDSQVISLYRVRRETQLDGEETLHWSYLGDVSDPIGTEFANDQTEGK